MKKLLFNILLVCFAGSISAQSIKQEFYNLNQRYLSIENYSASTKVVYFDASGNVEDQQIGKYVQHNNGSLYILGPYEVLSYGQELVQVNNADSTVIYMANNPAPSNRQPMDNYFKRVENYLKICKDSSITNIDGNTELSVELHHAVDNLVALKVNFTKDYILNSMEVKLLNGEKVRFEYHNVSFDKNRINKLFNRDNYLVGTGTDIQLNGKYSAYKFNNYSN